MEAAATTIIHKRPILTRNTLSQKYPSKLIEISPHFWWQVQTSLAKQVNKKKVNFKTTDTCAKPL